MKNQSIKSFLLVTIMFFILMIGGSIINYILSVVFMESFIDIQHSPIWVLHVVVILFFTISIGSDMEKEQQQEQD